MIRKVLSYYNNTIFPWDILRTRVDTVLQNLKEKSKYKKLNIGFCSVFPPFPNGAAAGVYYLMREFAKHDDVRMYYIPVKNKIDKRLFSFAPCRVTTLDDPHLDVVIFWCLGEDYTTYASKVACKKIAWQTMHDEPEIVPAEQKILDQIKQADMVFGITRWAYTCYKRQIGHVAYVPFGVDTLLFTSQKEVLKKQEQPLDRIVGDAIKSAFTCLFVSRFHAYKGIIPFLDAIPLVLEKDNSVVFRFIAAIDCSSPFIDDTRRRFQTLIKTYPQNIILDTKWLPYATHHREYSTGNVLVFPSVSEGFGIPLIEAMSAALPCIVLDKKPMSEIVLNGKTGFCLSPSHYLKNKYGFPFPHPKDIAEKILLLKRNKKKRTDMGRAARERVIEEYSLQDVVHTVISHCKALTSQ